MVPHSTGLSPMSRGGSDGGGEGRVRCELVSFETFLVYFGKFFLRNLGGNYRIPSLESH